MNNEDMRKIMLDKPANTLKEEEKNEIINRLAEVFTNMVDKVKTVKDLEEKGKKSITSTQIPFIEKRTYEDKTKQAVMDNVHNYIMSTHGMGQHHGDGQATAKIVMDMAERLMDKLPLKHFVGIQPMRGPVELIYSLQYRYADQENWSGDELENIGVMDETAGRKITLEIISSAVEAGSRKFDGIEMVIETMQDEAATNKDDDANKFLNKIVDEMALSIYSEIKNDISSFAFKQKGHIDIHPAVSAQSIAIQINRTANEIARKTRRGAGNYVIASKQIYNILKTASTDYFVKAEDDREDYGFVKFMGTLHGTIKIYCDLQMPDEKMLVGYKGGSGETDAGYFYCPYVPVMSTGVVINLLTFEPLITFMTRYGKQKVQHLSLFATDHGDGSSSETIDKKSSSYFGEVTFDNISEAYELLSEIKTLEKEKEKLDAFDEALKLVK